MIIHKEVKITKELLLKEIGAYNIFNYYMPNPWKLNRLCKNPFTHTDSNPSCIIGTKNNEITFKCFNSDNKGDCFSFVMQLFNISFIEALNKISSDFGYKKDEKIKYEIIKSLPIIELLNYTETIIQASSYSEFLENHKEYWKQYDLEPKDLQFCNDTKVYPLKEYWVNKRKMSVLPNELGFIYNVNDKYNKIYFPKRPKDTKWRSSVPFDHIHGLDNLKGCDIGIVTKSIKDAAWISKYVTKCVCVLQSENVTAINKENVQFLKQTCKQIYVALDIDKTGKAASYAICDLLGAKHVNPPDYLLEKKGTDFSDWVALEGTETVRNHFIKKQII